MKFKHVLIGGMVLFLWALSTNTKAQDANKTALRQTIRQFFSTYSQKDVDGQMALCSAQLPQRDERRTALQEAFATRDIVLQSCEAPYISIAEIVIARVYVQMQETDRQTQKQEIIFLVGNLTFVRENGWKVSEIRLAEGAPQEAELPAKLIAAPTIEQRTRIIEAEAKWINGRLLFPLSSAGDEARQQGDLSRALRAYSAMKEVAHRLNIPQGIASGYGQMANIYEALADFPRAQECAQEAIHRFENLGLKMETALAYGNLGVICFMQEQYDRAIKAQETSAQLFSELHTQAILQKNTGGAVQTNEGMARAYNNLGTLYAGQRNADLALFYLNRSLETRKDSSNRLGRALTQGNIGMMYSLLGQDEQALQRLEEARAEFATIEPVPERELMRTHHAQGLILMNLRRYDRAKEELQKALREAKAHGFSGEKAQTLTALGTLALKKQDYAQGMMWSQQAEIAARALVRNELLWIAQYQQGKALHALKKPNQSEQYYQQAVHTVEKLRNRLAESDQSVQQYQEDKFQAYQGLMTLRLEANRPQEALYYAEMAKARVLLDVLQRGRVSVQQAMNLEEQAQERLLYGEMTRANAQIYRNQQSGTLTSDLESAQKKARGQYEAFLSALYRRHPNLRTQRGQARIATPADWLKLLSGNDSAILSYTVADDRTWLFALTRNGPRLHVQFYPIEYSRRDMERLVDNFRTQLLARKNYRLPAQKLYKLLIGRAQEALAGVKHLIILPDATLWELPFAALMPTPETYLVQNVSLRYGLSLTALREMETVSQSRLPRPNVAPERLLLAFGNPTLGPPDGTTTMQGRANKAFVSLPVFEKQVEELRKIVGGQSSLIKTGRSATESLFRAEAPHYAILHLAAHAVANNASPLYSYVALAEPGVGATDDGLLEAQELMNMPLGAKLVVLSGCQTGEGRIGEGEGMIGLTWAFFVAGCQATVASQWEVNAESTSKLMLAFYKNLMTSQGTLSTASRAQALQKAQMRMIEEGTYPDPFYWAGFTLMGVDR